MVAENRARIVIDNLKYKGLISSDRNLVYKVKRALAVWLYERDRIIGRAKSKDPTVKVPDLLMIHEDQGRLTGYGESGIDQAVARFRSRM